jgi:hypothetical protein
MIKIRVFRKSDIDAVIELMREFDNYLQSLSSIERDDFDYERQREKLLRY